MRSWLSVGRKKTSSSSEDCKKDVPVTLTGHPFYGIELSDEQLNYANAIWDPSVKLVTVDSVAGSGKTTIAIAVSCLLYAHKIVDGCLYLRTPSSEGRIGFLPGTQTAKERVYMQPLYNSLVNIGENPYTAIDTSENMENKKYQTGYWQAITDVYLLGDDFKNKAIVVDEAQCMTTSQLRTILTRANDDCKCVVIGSTLQIQGIAPEDSGFQHCIEHFSDRPWARHCVLTKNYRGELSAWADKM